MSYDILQLVYIVLHAMYFIHYIYYIVSQNDETKQFYQTQIHI